MVDAVKELMALLEKLPHLALWILVGIFLYKVIFIGSIFGILKLLIIKGHDLLSGPRTVYWDLYSSGVWVPPESKAKLVSLLKAKTDPITEILHGKEIDWLVEAVREKTSREAAEKADK